LYSIREYFYQRIAAVSQHNGDPFAFVTFLAWIFIDENFSMFNTDSAQVCWKRIGIVIPEN
jgi:hypothetical protein